MQTYRRIDHQPDQFAGVIWNIEELGPRWFRDASHAWTPDFEAFLKFWQKQSEIWGYFNEEQLIAVVYLEPFKNANSKNIHVSIVGKCPQDRIVHFFRSLTRLKTTQGVFWKSAWILQKNRSLLDIAVKSGYYPSGLVMDYGASHGRYLRWAEVRHTTFIPDRSKIFMSPVPDNVIQDKDSVPEEYRGDPAAASAAHQAAAAATAPDTDVFAERVIGGSQAPRSYTPGLGEQQATIPGVGNIRVNVSADLENRFTYHSPSEEQTHRYEAIRAGFKQMAYTITMLTPGSAEQTLAIRKLEEAMFWANASIARNEKP